MAAAPGSADRGVAAPAAGGLHRLRDGLTALELSAIQVVVSLVVITLFVPCIASLMVLFKERGFREAGVIWIGSWGAAFLVGGLMAQLLM